MNGQRVHFIGIGGSGISALALLYLSQGKRVTGSDVAESGFTREVREAGGTVTLGHRGENVPEGADGVVFSEAIDKTTNPEYLAAQRRGIKTLSYFEALGEFSKTKKTIVVTGTHGKTTTTAMLGEAMIAAGLDPTVVVGTRVPAFGNRNLYIGKGNHRQGGADGWLVVEGCEYRRSFLNLHPFGVVMLNCETEHLDYYKDEADYQSAFAELARRIPAEGFLVINGKDKNLNRVAEDFRGNLIRVDETVGLRLTVPGKFNEWNAACALAAARAMGAEEGLVRQSLEAYRGSGRRMEIKGEVNGVTLIDDYGHHPTEVRETLKAIKERYPGRRLICVFQPHQYSRTHQLLAEFKQAFGAADHVIIPNIYEARDSDEDKKKISAESLVAAIGQTHPSIEWGRNFETTVRRLREILKPGNVLVTMGAGDIGRLAELFGAEAQS